MGEVTVSQDIQQSCLLVQVAITCSVSFVQLTNAGNITKAAVAKHEKLPLHFKYLKLQRDLKEEKRWMWLIHSNNTKQESIVIQVNEYTFVNSWHTFVNCRFIRRDMELNRHLHAPCSCF